MGRSLKGEVVSTGNGKIIPRKQAMEELLGRFVSFIAFFKSKSEGYNSHRFSNISSCCSCFESATVVG